MGNKLKKVCFGRQLKQTEGFSLLELLIAMAVTAILLAIIWPNVSLLSRWKVKTAAATLASDLRLARQEAITTGRVSRVVFFIYTNSYQLRLPEESRLVYLPDGVFFEGISFQGIPPYVHFNMLGHPSGGGTVILKSKEGDKLYVVVTPVTGRIRISRTPPEHW